MFVYEADMKLLENIVKEIGGYGYNELFHPHRLLQEEADERIDNLLSMLSDYKETL